MWKPGWVSLIVPLLLKLDRVSDSVFGFFAFFGWLFVVFAVAILLHYTFHDGFFTKTGNKFIVCLALFLLDYEHVLYKFASFHPHKMDYLQVL